MKVVAIIQARMGSTRLPGKVMMDLAGETMLQRVVNRVRRARLVDETVIATSTNVGDDVIDEYCTRKSIGCFRGSEDDVLDRYLRTAKEFQAEVVVRITSDCPLIDPEVIDKCIEHFHKNLPDVDYVSNIIERFYPRGLDTEVFSSRALELAHATEHEMRFREHVTHTMRSNPTLYRCLNMGGEIDYSDKRWTVDTPQDYQFIKNIYDYFGGDDFGWMEVIELLKAHPDWEVINQDVHQKLI